MLSISSASTERDRAEVYALRYDVYVTEMNLHRELADHARRRLSDRHDESADLLVAKVDGAAVGTLRIHDGSKGSLPSSFHKRYHLDRFLPRVPESQVMVCSACTVLSQHRSGEVPIALATAALERALGAGIELVFFECVPRLVSFYERLGYRRYATTTNESDPSAVVPMVFVMSDSEHWLRELLAAHSAPEPKPPMDRVLELLGSARVVDALHGLDAHDLRRLIERSECVSYTANEIVVHRGTATRNIFILLDGNVDVRLGDRNIARFHPCSVFGETNFFLGRYQTADVVAGENGALVLHLAERTVKELVTTEAALAAKLFYNLGRVACGRLAATMGS